MIPDPIFKNKLPKISWQKIYEREYGVQYSEVAVSLLANAQYHFPETSTDQIVIPGGENNTAFYIDLTSWTRLVEGLNSQYTSHVKKLEEYERQFLHDGKSYLDFAKKISRANLKGLTDKELLLLFRKHQDKRDRYSAFAWSAFILNNYVADRATKILDTYIKTYKKEKESEELHEALFRPEKKAAILQLQFEVTKRKGRLTKKQFEDLYQKFKWLSCLDIHNKQWTKQEFSTHIKSLEVPSQKKKLSLKKIIEKMKISRKDAEYLMMAKRFVYIKDARDDYRRESVFYALSLFIEIAHRMNIDITDISYLQTREIEAFLKNKHPISKQIIAERKNKFVLYLDSHKKLICLHGDEVKKAFSLFNVVSKVEKIQEVTGRVVSKGYAKGNVVIVRGVKDLVKVANGDILVAVATHPDYVPAMRRAAAIITDEGGITSHAAIVAREFGIPCIVGTERATKVFKNGDMVEVDCQEGIVRV